MALTAKILFHSSRVVSRNGTGEVIPAMFSTAPTVGRSAACTASRAASTDSSSATLTAPP